MCKNWIEQYLIEIAKENKLLLEEVKEIANISSDKEEFLTRISLSKIDKER